MGIKILHWLGIIACITLIVTCFLPWVHYADINQTFTGFYSYKNEYGKPGKFLVLLAAIILLFMLLPKVWAKRANLFVSALALAYAVKSFILFSSCYNNYCPEKLFGIYLIVICTVIILVASGLPKLKITKKIENARTVTKYIAENEDFMKSITVIFRKLHNSNEVMGNDFKLFELMTTYENLGLAAGAELFEGFEEVKKDILRLAQHYGTLDIEFVPCHIDPAFSNFILDEDDNIYLIDWEYSGMFDPMWDIAAYSLEAGYTESEEDLFVNYYFQREATALEKERIHLHKIFQDYFWSLWTLFKEEKGDDFGTYGKNRFERAKKNIIVFNNTFVKI